MLLNDYPFETSLPEGSYVSDITQEANEEV
jgi:hypothetical protein